MNRPPKTALGIDVSETRVAGVLVRNTDEGFRVVGAAQIPLPAETFKQGHLADAVGLLETIKALRTRGRLRAKHAALSLPDRSGITRVLTLEEDDPQRIARYVQNEIQQYAVLSGRETVWDYRVLASPQPKHSGRMIVSAMDRHAVAEGVRICRRAGYHIGCIEPTGLACLRAVHTLEPPANGSTRVLVAVLRDDILNLYVVRQGVADFVRTETMRRVEDGDHGLYGRVADEVNGVIRFYEREMKGRTDPWHVVVLGDDADGVDQRASLLQTLVTADRVDLRTSIEDGTCVRVDARIKDPISVAGFGLAVGQLAAPEGNPSINLLPPEAMDAKAIKAGGLLLANATAILILAAILTTGGLRYGIKREYMDIASIRRKELKLGQQDLLAAACQLAHVKERNQLLVSEVESLRSIVDAHSQVSWTELLGDIQRATPEVLQVTALATDRPSELLMEGLSCSYEAVHLFVEMLNRSELIQKASIIESERVASADNLVRYLIRCTLVAEES